MQKKQQFCFTVLQMYKKIEKIFLQEYHLIKYMTDEYISNEKKYKNRIKFHS